MAYNSALGNVSQHIAKTAWEVPCEISNADAAQ